MRDPDGYLIEVGEYSQTSLAHFKEYASRIRKEMKKKWAACRVELIECSLERASLNGRNRWPKSRIRNPQG